MPGAHAMSPLANRGAYKPPGMVTGVKRERMPLADVSNGNSNSNGGGGANGTGQGYNGVVGGGEGLEPDA